MANPRSPVEAKLNRAGELCRMAHDTVQLSARHPLSEAIEQLREASEEIIDAVSIAGDSALHANEQLAKTDALADALEAFCGAPCGCTPMEIDSGHRTDCPFPSLRDAADAALRAAGRLP